LPKEKIDPQIGIIGGTFDPIHWGHIIFGLKAINQFNLDIVVFAPGGDMPAYPKYKPDKSAQVIRHKLTQAALEPFEPLLRYSRIGLDLPDAGNTNLALEIYRLNRAANPTIYYLAGTDTYLGAIKYLIEYCVALGLAPEEIPLKIVVILRQGMPVQKKDLTLPSNWEILGIDAAESWGIASSMIKKDLARNFRLVPSGAWELMSIQKWQNNLR